MDKNLKYIKENLDLLEIKYPNIVTMWKNYIQVKEKSLNDSILDCKKVIEKLNSSNCEDIAQNTILLLYILSNSI
jgi:hypothetical protein